MYGVSATTEDLSSGGGSIAPGIHENVTVNVEFKKLKEDSSAPLLMVTYTANGAELRDIIWPINEQSEVENNRKQRLEIKRAIVVSPTLTIPKGMLADEHVLPRAHYLFGQKVFHIGKALIGEEAAKNLNGNTYADFAANMVKACANNNANCRLKVVLNKRDYSDVPKYGAFLENMAVVPTTALKITNSDKMVPTQPDATNTNGSNAIPGELPTEAPTLGGFPGGDGDGNGDLPF